VSSLSERRKPPGKTAIFNVKRRNPLRCILQSGVGSPEFLIAERRKPPGKTAIYIADRRNPPDKASAFPPSSKRSHPSAIHFSSPQRPSNHGDETLRIRNSGH